MNTTQLANDITRAVLDFDPFIGIPFEDLLEAHTIGLDTEPATVAADLRELVSGYEYEREAEVLLWFAEKLERTGDVSDNDLLLMETARKVQVFWIRRSGLDSTVDGLEDFLSMTERDPAGLLENVREELLESETQDPYTLKLASDCMSALQTLL